MKNNRFKISKDKHQWILTEYKKGTGRKDQPIITSSDTYYPKLEQVMRAIIDRELGCCGEALDILKALKRIDDRLPDICRELIGE